MEKITKHKGIRSNLIIIIFSLFVLLFVFVKFIFVNYFIGNLELIEIENGRLQVEKFENAIYFSEDNISRIVRDWAAWSETYSFLEGNNPDFIKENFYLEIFEGLDLNLITLSDKSGKYIYKKMSDSDYLKLHDLSIEIEHKLNDLGVPVNLDPQKSFSGLLDSSEGLILISSYPVLRSDYSGPVLGNMVFGKLLDQDEEKRYERLLKMDLSIFPLDDDSKLTGKLLENNGFLNSYLLDGSQDQELVNYSLIYDAFGEPVSIVSIKTDNGALQIAKNSINYILTVITSVMILAALLLYYFLENKLIRRLSLLTQEIQEIASGGFRKRVSISNNGDEISVVTQELNIMLENLESTTAKMIASEEKNHHLAYFDQLTGLPNKESFIKNLERRLYSAEKNGEQLATIFLDIDSFKMINDVYGHKKGDELLKMVAKRLSEKNDSDLYVSRVAGDEFLLLLGNIGDESEAVERIQALFRDCNKPLILDGNELYLTFSIGVSFYPFDGHDADTLIKNADIAMYKAKEDGKDKLEFISPVLKKSIKEKMQITTALFTALDKNEFVIHYQPQYDYKNGEIVGLEALLRWNSPEYGMVPPQKFIRIAEQTRLILPIGEWVLKKACEDLYKINELFGKNIFMAVNISIKQFQSNRLASYVFQTLKETGISPENLELEITESVSMSDEEYIMSMFDDLKLIGVKISLDDFGTDYSSLAYIKQMPINKIKIAMPFVQSIGLNKKDEAIIRTIVSLGENLDVDIIAEGVETKEQVEFLAKENCNLMQGYYFSKPIPFNELLNLLSLNGEEYGKIRNFANPM